MFQALVCKNVEFFNFLPEEILWMCVYLLFFFPGAIVSTRRPRMSPKGSVERKLKIIASFLSDQKLESSWRPSHAYFPPKPSDQYFEIAILFRIVEKINNYVFGDDLTLHSSRWKGCKLWTSPIVYIWHWLLGSIQTFSGEIFLVEEVSGRGVYLEGYFHGETLHGGREFFPKRGTKFPSIIKKTIRNQIKINKLSQFKVKSNIKIENEEKLLRIWRVSPLGNTSLFTLKFEFCSNSLRMTD